jgi:hypothetical protein
MSRLEQCPKKLDQHRVPEWFSGRLRVRSVHSSSEPSRLLIELEDVVAPTKKDAATLAKRLQIEAGFFFDEFEVPSLTAHSVGAKRSGTVQVSRL